MRNVQAPQQMQPQLPQINEEYLNQLKTLMNSKNASEYLIKIAQENPWFKQIIQMSQNGGNLQNLFENMARQRGVDPKQILQKLVN